MADACGTRGKARNASEDLVVMTGWSNVTT
jgi:hypothetical protein